jgi:hypothetical protein
VMIFDKHSRAIENVSNLPGTYEEASCIPGLVDAFTRTILWAFSYISTPNLNNLKANHIS